MYLSLKMPGRIIFTGRKWIRKFSKESMSKDIKRNPFEGLSKPEPLKYDLAGKWSRRITDEHRLVYQVEGNKLTVYTCRLAGIIIEILRKKPCKVEKVVL